MKARTPCLCVATQSTMSQADWGATPQILWHVMDIQSANGMFVCCNEESQERIHIRRPAPRFYGVSVNLEATGSSTCGVPQIRRQCGTWPVCVRCIAYFFDSRTLTKINTGKNGYLRCGFLSALLPMVIDVTLIKNRIAYSTMQPG